MGKVIVNGEILDESDPRAKAYRSRQAGASSGPSASAQPQARAPQGASSFGSARPAAGAGTAGAGAPAHGPYDPFSAMFPPGSSLGNINTQMQAYLPPMNVAGITVQPGLIAIALLVVSFFGVRGLLGVGLVLFLLSRR